MKRALYLLSVIVLLASCSKSDHTISYELSLTRSNEFPINIQLDGVSAIFNTANIVMPVNIKGNQTKVIRIYYVSNGNESFALTVKKNGITVHNAQSTSAEFVLDKAGYSSGIPFTGSSTSSPGSNGGSSSSQNVCPCGAPTKKGGSCQRMVKGCGRCWQH